jgi:hypothetical protein
MKKKLVQQIKVHADFRGEWILDAHDDGRVDATGDGWGDGWGMGEELHEEMGVGMHDNLLPQIQILQEILQQNNKNEKHKPMFTYS